MDFLWFSWNITQEQCLAHGLIFLLNVSLLVLAKPIVGMFEAASIDEGRVRIFRSLNVLMLLLHALDLLLLGVSENYEHYFTRLGLSLLVLYVALFFYSVSCYYSRVKFGRATVIDKVPVFLETYSTRIVELILLVFVVITAVLILIKLWGADSWLETTGILGVIAAFLAFTSHVWAPDIICGLIILNTQMIEDGDVVIIDGYPDEYIINKVSFIYITLLDIRNNHRTLMRNSRFMQSRIDNLSRIASADGIRQSLTYKIGYPDFSKLDQRERRVALTRFRSRVGAMFEAAHTQCLKQKDIKINIKRPFTWSLTSAGDYALEYTLFVFLARIPNTKVTSTVRKHLMGSVHRINEEVYISSVIEGIDLSTPALINGTAGAVAVSPSIANGV